jgi:hypothetical protein
MFIPAPAPDLHLPLTQRLEAKPVTPVTAVSGIPEDVIHLDSRVALQWTQPVLQGEKGQSARNILTMPISAEGVQPLQVAGFEPQGPDPDALLKGEVHPMLEHGLASWLGFVSGKAPKPFQPDMPTLQADASGVMPLLLSMYEVLAKDDIFAAKRLSESWLPRRANAHSTTSSPQIEPTEIGSFKTLAQTVSEPSVAQLSKWVSALEPDSESAQQAAQMLTQGQMVWLADLAPGVPLRMVREDAWRNNAERPAQLEKGAMLQVELNLPNLGRIRVVGSQWGQDISLQIAHDGNAQGQWTALAPSLLSDLQAQGIDDVRVETLPPPDEVQNG